MTVKELETYLLLHEQKVEGFVKTRSRNWLIAFGIAFILFIVLGGSDIQKNQTWKRYL
jgi:hypothetical protein